MKSGSWRSFVGALSMASSSEEAKVLEAAVAGIPAVAQIIASVPAENRTNAFDVVERTYLQIARGLGGTEGVAWNWTSAVMAQLRTEVEERMLANRRLLRALYEKLMRETVEGTSDSAYGTSDDISPEPVEKDIEELVSKTYGHNAQP